MGLMLMEQGDYVVVVMFFGPRVVLVLVWGVVLLKGSLANGYLILGEVVWILGLFLEGRVIFGSGGFIAGRC